MTALTKKEFEQLAGVHGTRCLSVFMPTHQHGEDVFKHADQIAFKNIITNFERELDDTGLAAEETQTFLGPAKKLMNDANFWRHQSDGGLAFFMCKDFFRAFSLPLSLEPYVYHSHQFYLTPLLPMFVGTGEFFLLALSLHEAKLYHGDREHLKEISLDNPLPERVEAVVGEDYQESFLGYHAMKQGGHTQATFHGHGDWKEDEKDEILSYFRDIDKHIAPVLAKRKAPLAVACLEAFFPIYQKANTYSHLYPHPILGSPTHLVVQDLHKKAWDMLAFHFDEERQQKAALFAQFHETERASTDIREVVPAAINGKVDTLFLAKNEDVWGVYDPADGSVRLDFEHSLTNISLTNLAAVQVFLNGGKVFLTERWALPMAYSAVNALYRY